VFEILESLQTVYVKYALVTLSKGLLGKTDINFFFLIKYHKESVYVLGVQYIILKSAIQSI